MMPYETYEDIPASVYTSCALEALEECFDEYKVPEELREELPFVPTLCPSYQRVP
jgi:hypothetical protein